MSNFNFIKAVRMVSMAPTTKLVAMTLATYADYTTGECYPTIQTLMADTGLSNRVVCHHIKQLEQMGILAVNRSNGRRSYYQLSVVNLNKAVTESHQLRKVTSDSNAHTGDFNDIQPVTLMQKAVTESHTNYHKQPIEQPIEQPVVMSPPKSVLETKTKPKEKPVIQKLIEHGCSEQLAKDFIAHRKTKKGAITDTALNLIVSQSKKAAIPFSQAIEICIARNWVSFNASWKWQDETPVASFRQQTQIPRFGQSVPQFGNSTNNHPIDVTPPKKPNDYMEIHHVQ